jgi:cytochrome c553
MRGQARTSTSCLTPPSLVCDGIAKNPDAPHLAGENVEYLMRQLKAFKSGERKHEQMSIIAQGLSDDDAANAAAWYSSIKIKAEMPQ